MTRMRGYRVPGIFLPRHLMLSGVGSLLAASNTVAGAGQDVSTIGRTVTTGAEQTKRATGVP
jgi:predicted small secreted protein